MGKKRRTGTAKTSRKGTREWRKNIDLGIDDEEEALSRIHNKEQVKQVPDESLFVIDTKPVETSTTIKSKKIRHEESILLPNPLIPVLSSKTRTIDANELAAKGLITKKEARKRAYLKGTNRSIIEKMAKSLKTSKKSEKVEPEAFDLWETRDSEPPSKKRRKLTKFGQPEPSNAPAVSFPKEGISYRPSFEAHQALEKEEVEREEKKIEAAEKLMRKLYPISRGKPDDDKPRQVDHVESEEPAVPFQPPKFKTAKQRRREEREKEREKAAKTAKEERQQAHLLRSLPAVVKKIKASEIQSKEKIRRLADARAKLPKRLGKMAYEEPAQDLLLSDELPQSLRQLKPEGCLMKDRLDSLKRRNFIEPRRRGKARQKRPGKVVTRGRDAMVDW